MSSSLLAPQVVATRAIYEVDEETSLEFSTRSMALLALPTADVTLHRLLSPTLKSWTTLHSGSLDGSDNDLSSLTIGATNLIEPGAPEGGWTGELAVGPGDATVSLDWGRTVWAGWDVKVGGSIGFNGAKGFLTWARKVTELIKLTLAVEGRAAFLQDHPWKNATDLRPTALFAAEVATGLTLKIRFYRLGQSIAIPITLVRKLDYLTVGVATLVPCVVIGTLQHAYLGPRRRRVAARSVPSRALSLRHRSTDDLLPTLQALARASRGEQGGSRSAPAGGRGYGSHASADGRPAQSRGDQDGR